MAEYIEREKAFKLIKEQKEKETGAFSKGRNTGLIIAGSIINNKEALPSADVAEVKHGHWIEEVGKIGTPSGITIKALVGYRCSVCNRAEINKEPYCNCGAKMDERSDT